LLIRPRDGRQVRAQLDGDDVAAALGQRHGGLPGPWADLQHPAAWADPRQLRQVVEQRRRVAWPRPVIQIGGLVEGRSQSLVIGDLDERWSWKGELLARLGPRLERTGPSLDAGELERLLRDVGFAESCVEVGSERLDVVYRDVNDWLAAEWTHGERRPLELMDQRALEAYRDEVAVAIEACREQDGALHWRPEIVLATARKH
jgi:hypothetical protein